MSELLAAGRPPVHGFVLAGGKSSRMGQDKATLEFEGTTLAANAVRILRQVCQQVSISGNREDLRAVAPVVAERRQAVGPLAGIEAGLAAVVLAATVRWALFVPVDVPLLQANLLRAWVQSVLVREPDDVRISYLTVLGRAQPACCLLHCTCLEPLSRLLDQGARRLETTFTAVASGLGPNALMVVEASQLTSDRPSGMHEVELAFSNLNTPEQFESLKTALALASDFAQTQSAKGDPGHG